MRKYDINDIYWMQKYTKNDKKPTRKENKLMLKSLFSTKNKCPSPDRREKHFGLVFSTRPKFLE